MERDETRHDGQPLDLRLVQQIIPHYRTRPFADLASTSRLTLLAAVEPSQFPGLPVQPMSIRRFLSWQWVTMPPGAFAGSDVVILPWSTRIANLPLLIHRAKRDGAAVALWGHARSAGDRPRHRRLRRWYARGAHAVFVYDTRARAQLRAERFGLPVHVIRNSLDWLSIDAAVAASAQRRDRWSTEGPLRVLYLASLQHRKRPDVLLLGAYLASVAIELTFVGDGPALEPMRRLADRLKRPGLRVRFVGRTDNEEEIASWATSADVGCCPDGAGLSVQHLLAYGLPFLTTAHSDRHGPEIEWAEFGVNAHGCSAPSSLVFAVELERLAQQPPVLAGLRHGAERTAANMRQVSLAANLLAASRSVYETRSANRDA